MTARDILQDPFFDDIRLDEHEMKAPFKIKIECDRRQTFDYENFKEKISLQDLVFIIQCEIKAFQFLNNKVKKL